MDGTSLSSHIYILNDNCIIKKFKDGKVAYCKYILECKLVVGNIVVSLDSEWIENIDNLNDRLRNVFKGFNDCIVNNYFLDNNYKYKGHKFNIIKYAETNSKKTTSFHYITDLYITDNIVKLVRKRWFL